MSRAKVTSSLRVSEVRHSPRRKAWPKSSLPSCLFLHSVSLQHKSEGSELLSWQGGIQERFTERTAWPQETDAQHKSNGAAVQGKYVYLFLWHLTCPLLSTETGTAEVKCCLGAETTKWQFHPLEYHTNGTLSRAPGDSNLCSSLCLALSQSTWGASASPHLEALAKPPS